MPLSLSLKCPFHSFVLLGLACSLTVVPLGYFYLKKNKRIGKWKELLQLQRFGVDERFTDVCTYRGLVFMSGQVATGDTIEEQTTSILNDIETALQKAGSDKDHILELTIWLANMEDYDRMNAVYDKWITPGSPPCRACVQAKLASPVYKIEIRVIAAKINKCIK